MIYERDPQLRQVIGNEVQTLTLEEKYQILQAYMNGGGVQGLSALAYATVGRRARAVQR
jgi:hypothetical protein